MEIMNDEEFRLLRDFINQKSGIFYNEKQKYIFQQKLLKRLESNALKNFKEYYYLLKYGNSKDEINNLYNVLTVNETYFFREKEPVFTLRDELLKELLDKRPNRHIKILSAGCSTGEEPYSISMALNDSIKNPEQNISITGLDISQKAIETAVSGNYRKISLTFRAMDKNYLTKYFTESDESYKLKDNIKSMVKFKQFNLAEISSFAPGEKFDIIFCRNVMIYFDKKFKQELINNFYRMLNTDGYFVMSNTENLNEITSDFKVIKKGNSFMYFKEK